MTLQSRFPHLSVTSLDLGFTFPAAVLALENQAEILSPETRRNDPMSRVEARSDAV